MISSTALGNQMEPNEIHERICSDPADPADRGVISPGSDPHSTRAGGQDDVSSNQTRSNHCKIYGMDGIWIYGIYVCIKRERLLCVWMAYGYMEYMVDMWNWNVCISQYGVYGLNGAYGFQHIMEYMEIHTSIY